jgi:hypothetical protein
MGKKTRSLMSTSSVLAVSFSMALAAVGPARAADERSSFTDRVQQSQGIARTKQVTTTEPAVAGEATSFIDRVVASQGIRSRGLEARDSAPAIAGEATSFITRVVTNQGISTDTEEGAASGEPSTR